MRCTKKKKKIEVFFLMAISQKDHNETNQEAEMPQEQPRPVILVVDDEEEIRSVMRLTLTLAGYDVREAGDGERALESLQRHRPDLILLDVLMPGMDGFEVCRRVRANTETAQMPVLILSAKTDARSREEGLDAGATKYLTKPISPPQLLQHIAEVLEKRAE
jgi:CheY-like chemotaxis protein